MSKKTIFTGAGVAIITPMNADGSVNFQKYREIIDWQMENGTDAIITCGTTGESSTLTHEEHVEVIRTAVEQTAGRVPVIAGTGSNDTDYGIKLSLEAKALGVDGLLLVTPYYNKASQRGLIAHYTAIADAAQLPIILYNVPSRTGVSIQPATVVELAKHPYIVGIKEASGNLSIAAEIAATCDIDIYSGNDDQILPVLSLGGKGVISVLSNILPSETSAMCHKYLDGDVVGARKMQLDYIPLIDALFCEVNPIPVKAACAAMGFCEDYLRLPLTSMEEANKAKLLNLMKQAGIQI